MPASESALTQRSATSFVAEQIVLGEPGANSQRSERGPAGNSIGIAFESVEKRFGSLVALRNISLEIRGGEFVALLGANGAGKTTLLRMAAQLMKPTTGSIVLTGITSKSEDARRFVGLVGHSTFLYDEMSAEENLNLFAQLYGTDDARSRAAEALKPKIKSKRRRTGVSAPHRPFLDTLSCGLYSLGYFLENLLFRACFRGCSRYDSAARGVPDVHRNPRT